MLALKSVQGLASSFTLVKSVACKCEKGDEKMEDIPYSTSYLVCFMLNFNDLLRASLLSRYEANSIY